MGGEAVPALQRIATNPAHLLQEIAGCLLRDISHVTARQLGPKAAQFLCPYCFTRYGPHVVPLLQSHSITYYGCRNCGQSRAFSDNPIVVATLDEQALQKTTCQGKVLRVNWSVRRQLFDFDTVEIIRASDEEVERFAMQVGNDTDTRRQARYKKMRCAISPQCPLSENTQHILRKTFGQVVLQNVNSSIQSLTSKRVEFDMPTKPITTKQT